MKSCDRPKPSSYEDHIVLGRFSATVVGSVVTHPVPYTIWISDGFTVDVNTGHGSMMRSHIYTPLNPWGIMHSPDGAYLLPSAVLPQAMPSDTRLLG